MAALLTLVYAMNFKWLIVATWALASIANAQGIYQQQMRRLNGDQHASTPVQSLSQYQGTALLSSFFMPDCRWCQRQHKVLTQLQTSCPKLQTIMLGVQGNKQKLRQELHREKNTFPAYIANKAIVQAIGAQSPVPMMLIFNQQGQLAFKTIGYTRQAKLSALLKQHKICS